ncbi:MAG: transcription antitermination factor NusB [Phycisphaerae bacterium]|nr:transcription antitermination factor NusB [Phycisphaerae bacterium]
MNDAPSASHDIPNAPGSAPTARSIVIERTAKRVTLFPDLPFDAVDTAGLDARDSAFACAIDAQLTRRWLTLIAVIESQVDRPWTQIEPSLQAALLVGAAQILLFDRIPDHASVDESVSWTKRVRGPRAGGFVNAVLRKVAGLKGEIVAPSGANFARPRDLLPLNDGRAWRLTQSIFSEDPTLRLAQVGSVGRDLLVHWIAAHGFRAAVELARHGLVDAPTLVTGVPSSLAASPMLSQHDQPGWYVFIGDHAELLGLLARHPSIRVQDPASGDPVAATRQGKLAPKVVIDLCAGRGTKTVQLAQTFPAATIVASDPDDARRRDLMHAATRHANIQVITPDRIVDHFRTADLVVLDVPCSNTAVLPRRPQASYRFSSRRLEQLVEKQREIAHGAMPLLKPGGHVLYSTCSLEPAENTRQIEAMRKRHRLIAVAERQRFPSGVPGDPPARYTDGGFWALLASTT